MWDATTGKSLFDLRGHTSQVSSVKFSPDGKRIVTASLDSTIWVWEAATGKPLMHLKGHTANVASVAFSPDGAHIASGSWDRVVRLWDVKTGQPLVDMRGHQRPIMAVSFSPDGTRIVTAGYDKTAKVWDARTVESSQEKFRHLPFGSADEIARRRWATRPDRAWHEEQATLATKGNQNAVENFHREIAIRLAARQGLTRPELLTDRKRALQILASRAETLKQAEDYLILGGLLLREGRAEEAIAPLKKAIELRYAESPPTEELLLSLAFHAANRIAEGRSYYRTASDWMDRVQSGCGAVSQVGLLAAWGHIGLCGAKAESGKTPYQPVQWEEWSELESLRAEASARFSNKP